ncbi:MAG: lipid-A-disaccharide synthase [Deltaproteobacteria bacterium]|nr:lipid-A-disaccharide synthase [Deltaproteobacteria bacterium]
MNSTNHRDSLLVVAGEPSGDRAAARVIERVTRDGSLRPFGVGGDHLLRSGTELVAHIDGLTALGPTDTAGTLGRWTKAWTRIREEVSRRRPAVALLVDAPDVNLPLARVLTEAGVRVVFYVGPQVWAWRKGRLGLLRRRTDIVALILPFEKRLYDAVGVRSVFVGHPILDEPSPADSALTRLRLGISSNEHLVAYLPGSRPGEIARHGDVMVAAHARLADKGIRGVFAPAPGAASDRTTKSAEDAGLAICQDGVSTRDVLNAADAAIVASGTATLEAAIMGTPLAAVYRLDRLSWIVGRLLVKAPYISLPNWIAGRRIIPELLQDDVTPGALTTQALALLEPGVQLRQKKALSSIARSLGDPGAADRVASLVLERSI